MGIFYTVQSQIGLCHHNNNSRKVSSISSRPRPEQPWASCLNGGINREEVTHSWQLKLTTTTANSPRLVLVFKYRQQPQFLQIVPNHPEIPTRLFLTDLYAVVPTLLCRIYVHIQETPGQSAADRTENKWSYLFCSVKRKKHTIFWPIIYNNLTSLIKIYFKYF